MILVTEHFRALLQLTTVILIVYLHANCFRYRVIARSSTNLVKTSKKTGLTSGDPRFDNQIVEVIY